MRIHQMIAHQCHNITQQHLRHPTKQTKLQKPPKPPNMYIICSPEGCTVVSNPPHTPPNRMIYLTPDYKDIHIDDDDEDPHSKLAI